MGLVSSVAGMVLPGSKPVTAALAMYDPIVGSEVGDFQAFQYFPEKISDSKGVDYASRTVPGGSHPIYTFISGGERTISFSAIFANDKAPEDDSSSLKNLLTGKASFSFKDDKNRPDVVNIQEAVKWLRSFLYPEYRNQVSSPPPLAVLYLPNSGIVGAGKYPDSIIGIITRADVSYEAFHRNGSPRIVVVEVELKEVMQTGEKWQFHARQDFVSAVDDKKDSQGLSINSLTKKIGGATPSVSVPNYKRATTQVPKKK